eukprot:768558-Hanusia_phi.AAC.3
MPGGQCVMPRGSRDSVRPQVRAGAGPRRPPEVCVTLGTVASPPYLNGPPAPLPQRKFQIPKPQRPGSRAGAGRTAKFRGASRRVRLRAADPGRARGDHCHGVGFRFRKAAVRGSDWGDGG